MSDIIEIPGTEATQPPTAKDPVCGMSVDPGKARGSAQYLDQTYYFCSPGCMHRFVSRARKIHR